MFTKKSKYSYQIDLPSYTNKAIIEWFEGLAARNRLSDEIIALVHENIVSAISNNNDQVNKPETVTANEKEYQDDFLNNLYNWQDSNNMIHIENTSQKKKKMLSV